jgi:hypothetical protein
MWPHFTPYPPIQRVLTAVPEKTTAPVAARVRGDTAQRALGDRAESVSLELGRLYLLGEAPS